MELEELDDTWIKEIEEEEKIYNKFYTSSPNYVNLYIIYLDDTNNIVHIKTMTSSLNNNILSKNKLIYYVSKYSRFHKKRYDCMDIVKYNIDVNSKEINSFIEKDGIGQYLSQTGKIDDIYWKNSVEILHSVNSLYIFYKQKTDKKSNGKTKKRKIQLNKKTRKTT